MRVEIDPSDAIEAKADERGRINLGTDYADKRVEVVIIGAEETDE